MTADELPAVLRAEFLRQTQVPATCEPLKHASLSGRLGEWTKAMTKCVVASCQEIGLRGAARAHTLDLLPVRRSEYLALDVMAFAPGKRRWLFPSVVIELENSSREDFIAYSLWKVLCVRSDLRVVFCYRKHAAAVPRLIEHLRSEVVDAMELGRRVTLSGRTLVVVGTRAEAETFPYGFFSWWELETNTGRFVKA